MNFIKSFVNKNFVLLCAGLVFFCIGITVGSVVAVNMSAADITELKNGLSGMLSQNAVNSVSFWDIVASESLSQIKTVALIAVCAYSVWLIPVSAFAISVRGYQLGFSVSFLCGNFGFRGIVLSLVSSLACYIVAMPVYISLFALVAKCAISRSRHSGFSVDFSLWKVVLGAYGILCVSACIQGLLIPIFIDFFI